MRWAWVISALAAAGASQGASAQPERSESDLKLSFQTLLDRPAPVRPMVQWDQEPPEESGVLRMELPAFGGAGELDVREDARMFDERPDLLRSLGLHVERSTALRDGGIDSSRGALEADPLAGYAEPHGEFDLYDISMNVGQFGDRDLGLSLLTGFRAIRAEVGQVSVSQDRAGNTTTTYHEGQGVVAVPVIGTGVHWSPTDEIRLRGNASTHTISNATFFDLRAEAEIRLAYNVGLTAGYEYVRSAMEVRNVEAELSEAGLFARLQIKF